MSELELVHFSVLDSTVQQNLDILDNVNKEIQVLKEKIKEIKDSSANARKSLERKALEVVEGYHQIHGFVFEATEKVTAEEVNFDFTRKTFSVTGFFVNGCPESYLEVEGVPFSALFNNEWLTEIENNIKTRKEEEKCSRI